jgi:hypothetical protein
MGLMTWLRGLTGASPAAEDRRAPAADRAERADRVDVSRLPPIQRTLGAQELVMDPARFEASLPTRQGTALSTPLGHLVSPDAPSGLAHGISAPAPAPRVQRTTAAPMPVRSTARPVAVAVPVQRTLLPGAALTSAGPGAVAAAELPVRQLVGEQPLVRAAAPPPEEPVTQGPVTPGPIEPGTVTPSPIEPGPVAQRAVRPPAPGPQAPPRRTPGLGAPLPALPPTAQREAAASVTGPREQADGDAGSAPGTTADTAAPEPGAVETPVAPLLGDAPPVPHAPGASGTPAAQRATTVPPALPPYPATAPGPVAPLLADRPLRLSGITSAAPGPGQGQGQAEPSVQRSGGAPPAPAAPAPASVPVRWTAEPTLRTPSFEPRTHPVQRLADPTRTAPASPAAPPAPPVQRRTTGGPPVPRSVPAAQARGGPRPTDAGAVAVAAGVAQRAADGSVVFTPPAFSSPARSPVVQRETVSEEPPPPEPEPVPDDPDPDPGPDAEAEAEPEPVMDDGTAPGGAPAAPGRTAGGGGGSGAPVVTDELVRALYAPLSRLLKADLRLERERAGFLIDTRH